MKGRFLLLVVVALIAMTGSASAQIDNWQFGGRILYVSAATTSAELDDTGARISLDSGPGLEFDATVKMSRLFSAEISLAASAHSLTVEGTDCCGDLDGGRALLVPLTILGQYHYPVYGKWDPYVGIGFTWAAPVYRITQAMSDAGIERLDLEGGGGLAAQIGTNYQMDNRWYANVDLRYLGYSLEARARTTEGDLQPVTLDTKPWVIGLGIGYRF